MSGRLLVSTVTLLALLGWFGVVPPARALKMSFPEDDVEVVAQNSSGAPPPSPSGSSSGSSGSAGSSASPRQAQVDVRSDRDQPAREGRETERSERQPFLFFDHVNADVSASGYNIDVTGNESRSFRDEGLHGLSRFSFDGLSNYGENGVFEFNASLRATDDRQVQPSNRVRILGIYGEFREPDNYRLRLGNVSASFSDYSLASSADLGGHLVKQVGALTGGWVDQIELYGGRPQRQEDNRFRRFNGGLRVQGGDRGSWLQQWGFNYVRTWDDKSSITDPASRTNRAVQNDVYSVDANLALTRRLRLRGEVAVSNSDTDTLDDVHSEADDWAFKLEAYYPLPRWGPFQSTRLNLLYEEVQPEFRSASAGGTPDNRRWYGTLGGALEPGSVVPNLDYRYSYEQNSNNLDDQRAFETETDVHHLDLRFSPFGKLQLRGDHWTDRVLRNTSANVSLRSHMVETSNGFVDRQSNDQRYELSTRLRRQSFSVNYNYVVNVDSVGPSDRRHREYGFTYGYRRYDWTVPFYDASVATNLDLSFRRTEDWLKVLSGGGADGNLWDIRLSNRLTRDYTFNVSWGQQVSGHDGRLNDVRRTQWNVELLGSRFYNDQGEFRLYYELNDVDEDLQRNNFQEEMIRADVQFSF